MFDIQPIHLNNEWISLIPLQSTDFDKLYAVAADPLIWEQHPNKNRYKKEVFENYFKGAIESKGAFLFLNTSTGKPIGSSRFCNYDPAANSIEIGYTFFSRECWGKPYNRSAKQLMINYAFQFVETIVFHIGACNVRSQKAIEKIGAIKIAEEIHQYFGEDNAMNFVYEIKKSNWANLYK
jgi:RimJ/RimL family protein N-acetyltransferase